MKDGKYTKGIVIALLVGFLFGFAVLGVIFAITGKDAAKDQGGDRVTVADNQGNGGQRDPAEESSAGYEETVFDQDGSKDGQDSSKGDKDSSKDDKDSSKGDKDSSKGDKDSSKGDKDSSKDDKDSSKDDKKDNSKDDKDNAKDDKDISKDDKKDNSKDDKDSSKDDKDSSKNDEDNTKNDKDGSKNDKNKADDKNTSEENNDTAAEGSEANTPAETPVATGSSGSSAGKIGPAVNVGDVLAGHALTADSPVGKHGRLYVDGANLKDQNGDVYQMHGVSTHGLAWFPEYVSEESFRTFKNNWNADVMRLAMYTAEYGGYCSGGDKNQLKGVVEKGVEYASKLGMYVIIDWHILSDGNPNTYKSDAIAFFDDMSAKYAEQGNVIYEICNEPNGGTSWSDVRSYAVDVIETIRKNDPYGIILVGTPQWSQLILDAARDPLDEYDNVMYTMHFYAATHKDDLRNNMETAISQGMPVFVSECSICDASGNGGIDYDSAGKWKDLMDRYHVSYVAWSVANKNETAALIDSGCSKTSDWSDNELSNTGKWFKQSFQN